MDLSIIIVTWNSQEHIKTNLEAIRTSKTKYSFEVFVVDNKSEDSTVSIVKNNFPEVKLIENQKNMGFGAANNQALKKASGRIVLCLNPDMKIFSDTIDNIIRWMDSHPEAWVAGCKLLDPNLKIVPHVRSFPGFLDQLFITLKISRLFPFLLNSYLVKDFDYTREQKVESVRGSFFTINRKAMEQKNKPMDFTIPFFDQKYFIWFEEVDFCRQTLEAGGEVWYTPAAVAIDLVGQSFRQIKTAKKQKLFRGSMLVYFKKWKPSWQYFFLSLAWAAVLMFYKVLSFFKK